MAWIIATSLCAAAGTVRSADQAQVEAAYLVNFLRYTTWPAPSAPGEPLVVVLVGEAASLSTLEAALRQVPTVQDRPLQMHVVQMSGGVEPDAIARLNLRMQTADAVYLRADDAAWGPWLGNFGSGQAVLTVGFGESFVEQGGMLGLYLDGNRLVFAANPDAVTHSGLRVSSKVMQLARNLQAGR